MVRSFVVFIACILTGCGAMAGKELVGKTAPDVRLYSLSDSAQINISDYRGHYAAFVFWATTCRSSGPILRRVAEYRKSHPAAKIVMVSLDKNDNLQTVRDRVRSEELTAVENMFSGNEEYDEAFIAFKGDRLPYIVVVDPEGKIVAVDDDDGIIYRYL